MWQTGYYIPPGKSTEHQTDESDSKMCGSVLRGDLAECAHHIKGPLWTPKRLSQRVSASCSVRRAIALTQEPELCGGAELHPGLKWGRPSMAPLNTEQTLCHMASPRALQ